MTRAHNRPGSPMLALLLALAALPLATSVTLADDREVVARARFGAAAIDWQPTVEHERLVLTVALPNGQVIRQELAAGEAPSFGLFDRAGQPRPDGSYTYELTAVPRLSAAAQAALARARETGDESALETLRAAGELPAPRIQSGNFAIRGGAFVSPDVEEPAARPASRPPSGPPTLALRDFVIADDLIVQGSACVGFDCVNGEAFSFDTVRLKENSTRLTYIDTSAAGFPQGDWQLRANDSAGGGANVWAVDWLGTGAVDGDTPTTTPVQVEGGATSNSIFVDSTGRVGFRTSTPVLDLHVNTGNTPAIRLEQNSGSGFTAQTWDIAGNEASFFVRDVTGGSRLPFRIRPGAPTSSIDISADGDVGIGTGSPDNRLHVVCNAAAGACGKIENSNATGFSGWEFTEEAGTTVANFSVDNAANTFRLNSTGNFPTVFLTESVERVRIDSAGDVGIACNNPGSDLVIASGGACANPSSSINAGAATFTTASSRTFKENLTPLAVPNILDRIAGIGVYNYDFINGPKDRVGLMAEDFHGIFGRGSDKYLNGDEVQMALWLAVQQLTARNQELTERLAALEAQQAKTP